MCCEEQPSKAIDGVVILDVEQARPAGGFEHIWMLVATRWAFCQSVA